MKKEELYKTCVIWELDSEINHICSCIGKVLDVLKYNDPLREKMGKSMASLHALKSGISEYKSAVFVDEPKEETRQE